MVHEPTSWHTQTNATGSPGLLSVLFPVVRYNLRLRTVQSYRCIMKHKLLFIKMAAPRKAGMYWVIRWNVLGSLYVIQNIMWLELQTVKWDTIPENQYRANPPRTEITACTGRGIYWKRFRISFCHDASICAHKSWVAAGGEARQASCRATISDTCSVGDKSGDGPPLTSLHPTFLRPSTPFSYHGAYIPFHKCAAVLL